MSNDLVKRLRCYADAVFAVWHPWVYRESADRIEAQAARIAELEAALKDMARYIWHGHWDRLKPETRALLPGGKDE